MKLSTKIVFEYYITIQNIYYKYKYKRKFCAIFVCHSKLCLLLLNEWF